MTKKQLELALYGSAALTAVGVFLPLTKLPIVGNISYYDAMNVEAILIVLLALSAPVLHFLGRHKWIFGSVAAVWLTLLFPAIRSMFSSNNSSGLFGKIADKASAAANEFASNLFMNLFDMSWGGFVFIVALLAFTVFGVQRALKKR